MSWITKYHQDSDFALPLRLEDKITIFEERVSGWQLEIADACGSKDFSLWEHSGWAVLMIVFSYFELIGKCRVGDQGGRESERCFGMGLKEVFPELLQMPANHQQEVESILYVSGRCGFYHSGMARRRILISHCYAKPIEYRQELVFINPHKLVPELRRHLQQYVAELRNSVNEEARRNFEKQFDYLQALDPLAPKQK